MGPRADRGAGVLAGVVLPERYEPIRRIASGGMATVWCARDRTLDRQVAIKLLAEPYAHDELAGRRFKREARAAARLSGHPNVVTIYDVGQAPAEDGSLGRPFLVMEFLPGGTVADALRAGSTGGSGALRWLDQAAAALDYAHRRGVIHRDVKPANFLLGRDRVLHVADFGIAQLGSEDNLTVSGEVLGTAAYLAPERALGQPATEASDRYALAVVAYELLVGKRPFGAEHFAAQARQHVEEPVPRASLHNPRLPPALDAVLARGMAKRPEHRYASARELIEAIDEAMAPGPRHRPTAATTPVAPGPRTPAAMAATRQLVPRAASASPRLITPVPRPADTEMSISRGHRGRLAALAALAAALVGVAIAAVASGGPNTAQTGTGSHATAARPPAKRHTTVSRPAAPKSTATSSPAPPAAPAPPSGAAALEAQGHQLMAAGNYQSAIPVLRQAVAAAPTDSLTYAYALFDLGRSLRLAGDPRAAVPILWRRLQIPNQTAVVRTELALALEALGQQAPLAGPPAHLGHHHGRGGGPGGGGPGGDEGD